MDQSEDSTEVPEVKFKPVKRKNLRTRIKSEDEGSDDEAHILARLEEARELQKLRERPNGVSLIALATGQKVSIEEEITCKDPFKVKSGGMVNMQALKSGKAKPVDDAYDTGIGTQFSAETNKRDEDEEMMKYIDEELAKRKGLTVDNVFLVPSVCNLLQSFILAFLHTKKDNILPLISH